jgi:hypothetical protein
MDEAAFSVDLAAAYTIIAALLVCIFFTATNAISSGLTIGYSEELKPLVEQVGDVLLKSQGSPEDWYMGPSSASNATSIGLSGGRPGVLSTYRVEGLYFFNGTALKNMLGLEDTQEGYGLRIEIRSLDGVLSRDFGYPLPPDTMDVCKSERVAIIKEQDGTSREAAVAIYLWRKNVGAV